jgi:hypothetical protein
MTRIVTGEGPRTVKFPFVPDYEPFKNDNKVTSTEGNDAEVCIQRVSFNGGVLLQPTVVQTSPVDRTSGRYPGSSYERKTHARDKYRANSCYEDIGEDTGHEDEDDDDDNDDEIYDEGEDHEDEAPGDDERE